MDEPRITILIDNNTTDPALKTEHGFSALIDYRGLRLLFDCGAKGGAFDNAEKMGIDLSEVNHVILSHDHYDHVNGFIPFCEKYKDFTLWLSDKFFIKRFWRDPDSGERHDTSGALTRELVDSLPRVNRIKREITQIEFGAYIISKTPRVFSFEPVDDTNFTESQGGVAVDEYEDEIALVLDLGRTLAVVSGCSHAGAANICEYARRLLGKKVSRFYGGMHLFVFDPARTKQTKRHFRRSDIKVLGACHCTGDEGLAALSTLRCMRRVGAGFSETMSE